MGTWCWSRGMLMFRNIHFLQKLWWVLVSNDANGCANIFRFRFAELYSCFRPDPNAYTTCVDVGNCFILKTQMCAKINKANWMQFSAFSLLSIPSCCKCDTCNFIYKKCNLCHALATIKLADRFSTFSVQLKCVRHRKRQFLWIEIWIRIFYLLHKTTCGFGDIPLWKLNYSVSFLLESVVAYSCLLHF